MEALEFEAACFSERSVKYTASKQKTSNLYKHRHAKRENV
jgi:hypothetical protein